MGIFEAPRQASHQLTSIDSSSTTSQLTSAGPRQELFKSNTRPTICHTFRPIRFTRESDAVVRGVKGTRFVLNATDTFGEFVFREIKRLNKSPFLIQAMQAQTLTTGATTPTSPLEFTTPPVAKEATQLSSTNCARFTVLCTYLVTIYCTVQICCTLYLSSYDSGLLSRCHISWMPILPSESSSQREVWRLIVPGERKFVVYCSLFQKNYPGTHLAWSYKWKQPFQFRSLFIS